MTKEQAKAYLNWIKGNAREYYNMQLLTIRRIALSIAEAMWYRVNHLLSQVEKLPESPEAKDIEEELNGYSIKVNYAVDQIVRILEEMRKEGEK